MRTLQDKIDAIPFSATYIARAKRDMNRAIQELREQIDDLKDQSTDGKWISVSDVLALIGEKK